MLKVRAEKQYSQQILYQWLIDSTEIQKIQRTS